MAKWSEENTIKFVENYVKYECLWNPAKVEYKNKQIRQRAYAEISENMCIDGFGPKEVIQKIKNIRSTYSQELRKIKDSEKSGAGTDDLYVPSLKWFKILDEILKSVSAGSLRKTQANDTETEVQNPEETAASSSTAAPSLESQTPKCSKAPIKRKRVQELHGVLDQLEGISTSLNTVNTDDENEFELFGRLVAKQLKSLPLISAVESQQYIQTYLNKQRLQQLTSTINTPRSSSVTSANSIYSYDSSHDYSLPPSDASLGPNCSNMDMDQQYTSPTDSSILRLALTNAFDET